MSHYLDIGVLEGLEGGLITGREGTSTPKEKKNKLKQELECESFQTFTQR